jgi:hypothetical protein
MMSRESMSRSFAALVGAGAMFLAATTAQAAMAPAPAGMYATSDIQTVGCLLGAHVGPAGVCIGGYHPYYHHRCWINRWGRRVCN